MPMRLPECGSGRAPPGAQISAKRNDHGTGLTEECTQIPENLARYIDYNAMAYDMEVGGDIFTIELAHGDVHIFWNH